MNKIINYVKSDKHTKYMSCAQYADWIPAGFKTENAFVVQEIILERVIDEKTELTHYYEAWKIEDGTCSKGKYQDSYDLFCIGHPMDDSDALKNSIGHTGSITFLPRVFLVKKESPLYEMVET